MQERLSWVAVVLAPLIGNVLIAGRSLLGGRMANPEILEGITTPSGGCRAELYHLPDGRIVIRELDEAGNLVRETFGHE